MCLEGTFNADDYIMVTSLLLITIVICSTIRKVTHIRVAVKSKDFQSIFKTFPSLQKPLAYMLNQCNNNTNKIMV